MTCECGQPVRIKKSGECRRCYHRRYYRENLARPLGPRAGSTPEAATPCTYLAAHRRVYAVRGRADAHACVACARPASEWAYHGGSAHEIQGERVQHDRGVPRVIETAWSPLVWDYDPMCSACHLVKDRGANTR